MKKYKSIKDKEFLKNTLSNLLVELDNRFVKLDLLTLLKFSFYFYFNKRKFFYFSERVLSGMSVKQSLIELDNISKQELKARLYIWYNYYDA